MTHQYRPYTSEWWKKIQRHRDERRERLKQRLQDIIANRRFDMGVYSYDIAEEILKEVEKEE